MQQIVRVLASTKILAALCLLPFLRLAGGQSYLAVFFGVEVLTFGAAAVWLITGSRSHPRAGHLGTTFLLVAAAFGSNFLTQISDFSPFAAVFSVLSLVQPEAFIPYFFSRFVQEFPRVDKYRLAGRLARVLIPVSLVFSCGLFFLSLLDATRVLSPERTVLILLLRRDVGPTATLFWFLIMVIQLVVLATCIGKARDASSRERQKVGAFVSFLAIGTAPLLATLLLEDLIPVFGQFMDRSGNRLVGGVVVWSALASIPLTTGYSVLADNVMRAPVAIRRSLELVSIRYTIASIFLIPLPLLIYLVYSRRAESLAVLASDRSIQMLFGLVVLYFVGFRVRHKIGHMLDRAFLLEANDPGKSVMRLALSCHQATTLEGCVTELQNEIRTSFKASEVIVMLRNSDGLEFRDLRGEHPPLALSSSLVTHTVANPLPMETQSWVLQEEDDVSEQWLRALEPELVLPLFDSNGIALGVVSIGERQNELPFSQDDRRVLSTLGSLASTAIENLQKRIEPESRSDSSESGGASEIAMATRCDRCGRIESPVSTVCSNCRGALTQADLPQVLAKKYRLDAVIGEGGMGVVYRATDLELIREVAVKYPSVDSSNAAMRLRNEARAMVVGTHPNVAVVYVAERWRNRPLLILELFQHGTLRDRLDVGPLSLSEMTRTGISLCGVLQLIHTKGVVHRDIKPSNIGLTSDGTAKLMDFGLAKFLSDDRSDAAEKTANAYRLEVSTLPLEQMQALTEPGEIVGTPSYMSPEAACADPADTSFDLWSLGITLLEAWSGTNPMIRSTVSETLEVVRTGVVPSAKNLRADTPTGLSSFFAKALHSRPQERFESAAEIQVSLEQIAAGC